MTAHDPALLTPVQEHYLKKYLLGVLIKSEFDRLQTDPFHTLPNLGGPFDLKDEHANSNTPFLRYLFESVVVPFPFLTNSKGALWPKLQLFMEEWAKLDAGNGVEQDEIVRRQRLKNKAERTVVLLYSMAIKTVEQRAQEKKDADLRQQKGLEASMGDLQLNLQAPANTPAPLSGPSTVIHGIRINVAGIRVVMEKRHVREYEHAAFLVSSTLAAGNEYIVARRHNAFRRLYASLREEFPQFEFPLPPAKFAAKSGSAGTRIAREKDRISLRGYLHNLARVSPDVVNSIIFVSFLTEDPVTLTPDEAKDVRARAAIDEHRLAQQAKFDSDVAKKVEELDTHLKQVKLDLLQPDGLSRLFSAFSKYDKVEDLPPLYQTVFEWGCMNFASTLYHVFTASDDATLNLTQLKRTHLLMPYRAMWGILKVSNPMAMMKGIMDLFLAQPFGSRSLIQRIISVNIQEEISVYRKDITQLEAAIGDPGLCEKIKNYIYAPKSAIDRIFPDGGLYDITELSLVMHVLKSDQIQPALQPAQIMRVWNAQQQLERDDAEKERRIKQQQSFLEGNLSDPSDDDDDENSASPPPGGEASTSPLSKKGHIKQEVAQMNLIRLLQQLLVTQLRIRDKERMMSLVFQGVTGEIFKELISIFYEPLVAVYKSANVADSLMDVKSFTDELIKLVEQADVSDESNSGKTSIATQYLNLVKKHLPSFYRFVHSVYKEDDGLFRDLLEWVEGIISFMRTGYARMRIDHKTQQELRATIDLDSFVKSNVSKAEWEELQKEAELLRGYFSEVKERKREEVRRMAGLDHNGGISGQSLSQDPLLDAEERDREKVAHELRGMGMQQEDVDELEMINYQNRDGVADDDDEGEGALKVPKVPVIDALKAPFVTLIDKALFQSARE